MHVSTPYCLLFSLLLTGCLADESDLGAVERVAASTPDELAADSGWPSEAAQSATAIPECPGVPYTGLDRIEGLTGYYLRTSLPVDGELVTLSVYSVEPRDGWIGVDGSYSALVSRNGLLRLESGRYVAVPNNPAIGPALALDTDRDGEIDEVYFILGATRNIYDRIDQLCLGKSRPNGSGSPFPMARLGF